MAIINAALSNRWTRQETPVPSLATVSLDKIPLSQYRSTKYLVEMAGGGLYKSLEMWASRQGATVNDSVYAKIGDALDISLNLGLSGPDVILSATNNEAFSVTVTITKTI